MLDNQVFHIEDEHLENIEPVNYIYIYFVSSELNET